MSIRHAVTDDRDFFIRTWREYLTEMHDKGSEIIPTDRTVGHYAQLFDAYVSGDRNGVVAIHYPIAVSMAGDCTPPWDSENGKTAIGWGTYVVPQFRQQHHADLMREFVIRELQGLGFRTIIGTVGVDDTVALASICRVPGVEVVQHVYRRRLT